jgi:hypothetical protein
MQLTIQNTSNMYNDFLPDAKMDVIGRQQGCGQIVQYDLPNFYHSNIQFFFPPRHSTTRQG